MSNDEHQTITSALAALHAAVDGGQLTCDAGKNIERWLVETQYKPYRIQLVELIDAHHFTELDRLFWERIPFGTGGRRGPMSTIGSATINERTIAESAHGLATYVLRHRKESSRTKQTPRAVVAFDTRHRSEEFARLTACVLAANGFHVDFFPQPRSTPELSFAVRHLQCDTGVMISASHNPPSDNGFKAYWSTGGQILPPHDAGIIACVDKATDIPVVDFDLAVAENQITLAGESIDAAYVAAVCDLSLSPCREISALYTPLHGVGETSVYRVVKEVGFDGVSIFEPQRSQDGSFPNVPDQLPNPERFAVFGPAIESARQIDVDLILASDPDADRMAVAVRNDVGDFICLTGNQLGSLLTDYVLRQRAEAETLSPDHYIIETLVTTPLIADIGHFYGVQVIRDVLVGFKYIAGEIDARCADQFVFAAEESIGFMAGNYSHDKDAAIGALYVLELAAELKRQGQTLLDRLNELYDRHGFFLEETISKMCPGPTGQAQIQQIMSALRSRPSSVLGGCVWESVRDFRQHEVRSLPSNNVVEQLPFPSGDLLIFSGQSSECHITLAMRPSGTEPKIKFYYFINRSTDPSIAFARERAMTCLNDIRAALDQWMQEVIEA
ncbi:MAG: phosphoglucomutase/phosphomannomutase alpha/beta/alpha domain [Schlesneria sp.]|nr:phosphoglucomutase/phosphomannomutase alpha/beta/alpha domain [Schlesneria sp.]